MFKLTYLSLGLLLALGGCRNIAGYAAAPDAGSPESGLDGPRDGAEHDGSGDGTVVEDLAGDPDAPPLNDLGVDFPPPVDSGLVAPSTLYELFIGDTGHFKSYAVASTTAGQSPKHYLAWVGELEGELDLGGGCSIATTAARGAAIVVYTRGSGGVLSCVWAQSFTPTNSSGGDRAGFRGVALDATRGRLHVVGYSDGAVDLGGGPLAHRGATDIIVGTFDLSTGAHQHSASWGSTLNDSARAVAVHASSGDALITGSFTDRVNFDGHSLGTLFGGTTGFILRYAPGVSSTVRWARTLTEKSLRSAGHAVAVLGDTVFAAGSYGKPTDILFSAYPVDNSTVYWSETYGTAGFTDSAQGLAVDALSKRVYMVGHSNGTLTFGALNSTAPLAAPSSGFLVSLNGSVTTKPTFERLYRTASSVGNSQRLDSVAVDSFNEPVVCGGFNGTLALPSAGFADLVAPGEDEGFCLRFGPYLGLKKSWLVAGGENEEILGVALSGSAANARYLAIAGTQSGLESIDGPVFSKQRIRLAAGHAFSQGQATAVLRDPVDTTMLYVAGYLQTGYGAHYGKGGEEGFVAKYELTKGALERKWISYVSGLGNDRVEGLAADTAGRVFIVGSFESTGKGETSVGPSPSTLTKALTPTNKTGIDGFVAALNNNNGAVIWQETIGGANNDRALSVVVHGNQLAVAGIFDRELQVPRTITSSLVSGENVFLLWFAADTGTAAAETWSVSGPKADTVGGLGLDGAGNAVIVGSFQGSVKFGLPNELPTPLNTPRSGYAVSFKSDRAPRWVRMIQGKGVALHAVARRPGAQAQLQVLGTFDAELEVHKSTYPASGGGQDGFALALDESTGAIATTPPLALVQGGAVLVEDGAFGAQGELLILGSYKGSGPFGLATTAEQTPFLASVDLQSTTLRWVTSAQASALPANAAALDASQSKQPVVVGAGTRVMGQQPWLVVLQ